MKKITLTILCAIGVSGAAFAQGFIQWVTPTTAVSYETNTAFSPLFGGPGNGGTVGLTTTNLGGFDEALLTQTDPTGVLPTDTNVWDGTWTGNVLNGNGVLTGTNSGAANGFGKINAALGGNAIQVNWANGTTNGVVLVAWSTDLGNSWAVVSNILAGIAVGNYNAFTAQDPTGALAYFGETAFGYLNPNAASPGVAITQNNGTPGAAGLGIFSPNTQLYEINPTPEPASLAVAGLGGLSLLLFRRRKS